MPAEQGTTPLYVVEIEARFDDGTCVVLYSSYGAVDPASPHRTRNQALWKARAPSRTGSRRSAGSVSVMSSRDEGRLRPSSRETTPSSGAVSAPGRAGRPRRGPTPPAQDRAGARPGSSRPVPLEHRPACALVPSASDGFVAARVASPAGCRRPVRARGGRRTRTSSSKSWAATGKAHISYVRLGGEAAPVGPPATALETPYHLSYPFVFRHEDDIFMIPESSANRTVELYRASVSRRVDPRGGPPGGRAGVRRDAARRRATPLALRRERPRMEPRRTTSSTSTRPPRSPGPGSRTRRTRWSPTSARPARPDGSSATGALDPPVAGLLAAVRLRARLQPHRRPRRTTTTVRRRSRGSSRPGTRVSSRPTPTAPGTRSR